MLGRRLAALRTSSGRVAVLDARCSHLGADLGRGRVVGEALQCPFHHWEYGADGRCTRIPSAAEIPAFACQTSFPVEERHGYIFFFNGPEPLFPLPFFPECRVEDWMAGRPLRFLADCPWYMPTANSFDCQHFQAGHGRRLLGPPQVDCPDRFARRIRFAAEVAGNSVFDRLLRRFAGNRVDVSITNWGGTVVIVTGTFRSARSYLMAVVRPLEAERSTVEVLVFARRGRVPLIGAWLTGFNLWVRRLFTWAFMEEEYRRLLGIRYNPGGLIDGDREMLGFFQWIADLPRENVLFSRRP